MTQLKEWLKDRENLHRTLFYLWLIPGAIASILLSHSLVWVVGMSWYAIVATHWGGKDTAHAAKEAVEEVVETVAEGG